MAPAVTECINNTQTYKLSALYKRYSKDYARSRNKKQRSLNFEFERKNLTADAKAVNVK